MTKIINVVPPANRAWWLIILVTVNVFLVADPGDPVVNKQADNSCDSYATAMVLNALIPGINQFQHQRPVEALIALSSLPLLGIGQYFYWSTLSNSSTGPGVEGIAEQLRPDQELTFWAGRSLSWLGLGLWSASQWTAHRDELLPTGLVNSEGLIQLLSAAFRPEIVFDEVVILPLATIGLVRLFSMPKSVFKDFFEAEHRYLLGYIWHPAMALGVRGLSSGLAALGTAITMESLLRGLVLERSGFGVSVAMQAGLSLMPYISLGTESINSQLAGSDYTIVSDLLFAAYAALISQRSASPSRALALHFWLETMLAMFNYIEATVSNPNGPTEGIGFGLKVRY